MLILRAGAILYIASISGGCPTLWAGWREKDSSSLLSPRITEKIAIDALSSAEADELQRRSRPGERTKVVYWWKFFTSQQYSRYFWDLENTYQWCTIINQTGFDLLTSPIAVIMRQWRTLAMADSRFQIRKFRCFESKHSNSWFVNNFFNILPRTTLSPDIPCLAFPWKRRWCPLVRLARGIKATCVAADIFRVNFFYLCGVDHSTRTHQKCLD